MGLNVSDTLESTGSIYAEFHPSTIGTIFVTDFRRRCWTCTRRTGSGRSRVSWTRRRGTWSTPAVSNIIQVICHVRFQSAFWKANAVSDSRSIEKVNIDKSNSAILLTLHTSYLDCFAISKFLNEFQWNTLKGGDGLDFTEKIIKCKKHDFSALWQWSSWPLFHLFSFFKLFYPINIDLSGIQTQIIGARWPLDHQRHGLNRNLNLTLPDVTFTFNLIRDSPAYRSIIVLPCLGE